MSERDRENRETHPYLYAHISAGLAILIYLATALRFARITRLWMDEVLSVWLVRMPGVAQVWQALLKGVEYSPPGYPVLIHWWTEVAGSSDLAMRLPSIAGILVAALAVFVLLRQYLDDAAAVLGLSLMLSGTLYDYALQVRSYALTVACFAVVLVLWDGLHRKPDSRWRVIAIAAAMSLAISMHYYCALYLASLGVIEGLYAVHYRRFRAAVWSSFVVSGLSVAPWLPLAHRIGKFLHSDQGPRYFAAPTPVHFIASIVEVLSVVRIEPVRAICLELVVFILCLLLLDMKPRDPTESRLEREKMRNRSWPLVAIAIGSSLLPVVTFLFALLVSGAYKERYVLPAIIGVVLWICLGMERLPYRQVLCPSFALLAAATMFSNQRIPMAQASLVPQAFAAASQPYPIALAEGLEFLQEMEDPALSSIQKSRIVYLTMPAGYLFPDGINENVVVRWKQIKPGLSVFDADSYLATRRCFYDFDTHKTSDDLTGYLAAHGAVFKSREWVGGGELIEVCPSSSQ